MVVSSFCQRRFSLDGMASWAADCGGMVSSAMKTGKRKYFSKRVRLHVRGIIRGRGSGRKDDVRVGSREQQRAEIVGGAGQHAKTACKKKPGRPQGMPQNSSAFGQNSSVFRSRKIFLLSGRSKTFPRSGSRKTRVPQIFLLNAIRTI